MRNLLRSSLIILLFIFSLFSVNMNIIRIAMAQPPDIAVTSVTPSATFLKLGELVNITVVVQNQGTVVETFYVTLYRDTTAIEIDCVGNLEAGLSADLVFTWNTADTKEEIQATTHKEKAYRIIAEASILPGETDTQDNMLLSPSKVRVISQYIEVIPQRTVDTTLTPGKNYTVSIYTDYNGSDICSWQFILTYNPAILEGIEVRNGDLITTLKSPYASFIPGNFNNTLGKLSLTGAFFYFTTTPDTTSGPGTLAYVTFRVVGTGDSNITLLGDWTKLLGPPQPPDYLIPYPIIDGISLPYFGHVLSGYFRNTAEAVTHDIAVISVTAYPTMVVVGEPVNITVVVENQGTVAETFDVKAYYDYDPTYPNDKVIGTKTRESLEAGAKKTLAFTWNTTWIMAGNYTITALVHAVPGEVDTADNRLQSGETVAGLRRDLAVSLEVPDFLMPGNSTLVNATVYNFGIYETNVELQLLINGNIVNSTIIGSLSVGASYTLSYLWTPTVEATYNVTVYAPPMPNEYDTIDNVATKFVAARSHPLIPPTEGQWANYRLSYLHYDKITGEEMVIAVEEWNITYDYYVSPYRIMVTLRREDMDGRVTEGWIIVNTMNRRVEMYSYVYWIWIWSYTWYPGWIETNINLGSTVNLLDGNATVVGSRIIKVGEYPINCWELSIEFYGYEHTFWYDMASGLWIGMEFTMDPYRSELMLVATNIPIGAPPVASFTYTPHDPIVGETVTFNASASYDPKGTIVSYKWDFGDGTAGNGMTTTHAYAEAGTYTVTLTVTDDDGLTNTTTSTVTVSRTTLDIEVDVGSVHFRGEMAEFYVLVSIMGEPVDADISATLHYSNGTLNEDLTASVEHIGTGLYRIPYTIPLNAPAGTYALVVNAGFLALKGTSLKSFLLSPTLTSWNAWIVDVQGDNAIIRTDVSTIKVSLEAINAKLEAIEEMLPFKKGKVAVIKTDIGTVRADLADINAELVSLNGRTATIQTDVGALTVDTESIELKVINVEGNIATISTTLGTIQGRIVSIQGDIATIETDIGAVEAQLPLTQTSPAGTSIEWTLLPFIAVVFIIAIAATALLKKRRGNYPH